MYADYQYYTDVFLGKAIQSEDDFNYLSGLACDEMNSYPTVQKLDVNVEAISTALKRCQCRVADIIQDGYRKAGISSESVNGYYNVSYAVLTDDQVKVQIANAIKLYLGKYIFKSTRIIVF